MTNEAISILQVIKKGDIDASLMTTFNATFPFYEDFLLRHLTSAGCRRNVLMVDQRQCAVAYTSEATRPRSAGIRYSLVPIAINGAFHPKICLLAGKKKASLFVGSHNLTVSGFGYNREVTNHVDLVGPTGSTKRFLFAHAWSLVRGWLASMSDRLPSALLDSALELDSEFDSAMQRTEGDDTDLITQQPGGPGLLDQLAQMVSGEVKRITVVGAFFDEKAAFLSELLARWQMAAVVVGIDPATVWMSQFPSDVRLRVVNAAELGGESNKSRGYLHAKAIYFECTNAAPVFASGSANPSAPAWLSIGHNRNIEAMLVRTGAPATACAKALEMDELAALPRLGAAELRGASERSQHGSPELETSAPPVLVGIADHQRKVILVELGITDRVDEIIALDESERSISDAALSWSPAGIIEVPADLETVRTLVAKAEDRIVYRILVHHPEVVARMAQGAARTSAAELLYQFGSEAEDISRLIPLLEKIIFSETVAGSLGWSSGGLRTDDAEQQGSQRPPSLEIRSGDSAKRRRKSLWKHSNDLAELIKIVTSHIDVHEETAGHGFSRADRFEEEERQDEQDSAERGPAEARTVDDVGVAESVCKRASKLCKRMGKALRQRESTVDATTKLTVQLIGVLALLQQLEQCSCADRWRRARLSLLWFDDLEDLFIAATDTLLSPGDRSIQNLCISVEEFPEEVGKLVSLMLWLAWIAEMEWATPVRHELEYEEKIEAAFTNARLLPILLLSHNDDEIWRDAEKYIFRTCAQNSISAGLWVERHRALARQLHEGGDEDGPEGDRSLLHGDIVKVPGVIDWATVVVDLDGRYVSVLAADGEERQFLVDRVARIARL